MFDIFLSFSFFCVDAVYGRTHMIDAPVAIPSISIPIGHTTYYNMPIGLQFHARSGDDGLLLAVGEALQPLFAITNPSPPIPKCYGCFPKATPLLDFNITANGPGYEQLLEQLHTVTFAQGSQFELDMMGECELKKDLVFPRGPPTDASVLGPFPRNKQGVCMKERSENHRGIGDVNGLLWAQQTPQTWLC